MRDGLQPIPVEECRRRDPCGLDRDGDPGGVGASQVAFMTSMQRES
ncbi:hypothetical protein [Nonomuraea sp. bgisy101]